MDICSVCKNEFSDEQEYLDHTCFVTGHKPTEPEHLGEAFILQSKQALKRTKSLDKATEKELDAQIKVVKDEDIEHKLMLAKEDRLDEIE
jgi:hypothetical protein